MAAQTQASRRQFEFSLFDNDPTNRLLGHIGLTKAGKPVVLWRLIGVVVLTWGVQAVLAHLQRLAINPVPAKSFLLDFAAYSQFLFALPLLIVAECYIDNEIGAVVRHLRASSLIEPRDQKTLESAIAEVSRLRRKIAPEVALLILAYASVWLVWLPRQLTDGTETWHALLTLGGERLTFAGWWAGLVSVPIFNFWAFRWVWKYLIWLLFLWRTSKLNLQLRVEHPDGAGGLGFFGVLHGHFSILIAALGVTIAANAAYKVVIEMSPLVAPDVWLPIVALIVAGPLAFLTPLLLFMSRLMEAKREGILEYSALCSDYASSLKISGPETQNQREQTLRVVSDITVLENLGTSLQRALKMHIVPFGIMTVIRLIVVALVSLLPLLLQFLQIDLPIK